jgi:hypothetical protein
MREFIFFCTATASYSPARDFTRPFLPSFRKEKKLSIGFVMASAVDCVLKLRPGLNAPAERARTEMTASLNTEVFILFICSVFLLTRKQEEGLLCLVVLCSVLYLGSLSRY